MTYEYIFCVLCFVIGSFFSSLFSAVHTVPLCSAAKLEVMHLPLFTLVSSS